jgi:hypothetical protein
MKRIICILALLTSLTSCNQPDVLTETYAVVVNKGTEPAGKNYNEYTYVRLAYADGGTAIIKNADLSRYEIGQTLVFYKSK